MSLEFFLKKFKIENERLVNNLQTQKFTSHKFLIYFSGEEKLLKIESKEFLNSKFSPNKLLI